MGAVYRAQHLLLGERRALKVIRDELFRSVPQAIERFEREARIAVRLRHPNLVLLHDFFVEDGAHFLVMEYVVGQSLGDLLRARAALSTAEICAIGTQCCAGLAHAHELGIVHRDLSPENVMLTPTAEGLAVKIIDFGVARGALSTEQRIADATLTRAGDFIGKPRYASPEQAGSLRPARCPSNRSPRSAISRCSSIRRPPRLRSCGPSSGSRPSSRRSSCAVSRRSGRGASRARASWARRSRRSDARTRSGSAGRCGRARRDRRCSRPPARSDSRLPPAPSGGGSHLAARPRPRAPSRSPSSSHRPSRPRSSRRARPSPWRCRSRRRSPQSPSRLQPRIQLRLRRPPRRSRLHPPRVRLE